MYKIIDLFAGIGGIRLAFESNVTLHPADAIEFQKIFGFSPRRKNRRRANVQND